MSLVELAKRIGIIAGALIATATVLAWVYAHTAGPVVAEGRANTAALATITVAQSGIVTRLEQMERRQDDFDAWRKARGRSR